MNLVSRIEARATTWVGLEVDAVEGVDSRSEDDILHNQRDAEGIETDLRAMVVESEGANEDDP